ncbi:MAG: hypothetical protein ABWY12_16625 [Burkholderiales bacterium]
MNKCIRRGNVRRSSTQERSEPNETPASPTHPDLPLASDTLTRGVRAMKQKRGVLMHRILVAAALSIGLAGGAWATQSIKCGSNVSREGKTITVKPTGISDTENLQCALDLAVAAGRGSVVELAGPTGRPFHTAQLVAKNFKGTIRGKGMKRTIIQNLPDLCVAPDNYVLAPPTPPPSPASGPCPAGKNPWPILLTVDGGDVVVSDLAIQIVGDAPTKEYTLSAIFGPSSGPITILQAAIGATGTNPQLRVSRVSLSGQDLDPSRGINVENGVVFTGGIAPGTELSGYCVVTDSYIKNMFRGSLVITVKDATVVFVNNTFDSVGDAVQFGGLTNTDVRFVKNKVSSFFGVLVADFPFPPGTFTNSRLFIAHNTFSSQIPGAGGAIGIIATFNAKTSCLVVLNDTTAIELDDPSYPILLGPGTKDCLVVTREANTVNDQGANNRIITVPWR